MKAAVIATGLGAILLLGMCQKSPTTTNAAAVADPSPAAPLIGLDADRSTVTAAHVQCRAEPSTKAALVVRLVRGARLDVMERRGAWAKVSPTGEECWVVASQIDDVPNPDRAPAALYASSASDGMPTPRRHSSARPTRPRRSTGPYSGGSCPCGSGNICIGPRGGRYCITSGGNKRYGM